MKRGLKVVLLSAVLTGLIGLAAQVSEASTLKKELKKYRSKNIEVYFLNSPIYPKGLSQNAREEIQNTEIKRQRIEMSEYPRDPILERNRGWYSFRANLWVIRW